MSPDNHHPPKKSRKSKNGTSKEFRFINHDLDSKDKEWLEACDLDTEFPLTSLSDLVEAGYKFSLSNDVRNNTFVASITDRDEGSAFYNACLTGRGATPVDAWYSLCYRHLVLAQGDWAFFSEPGKRGTSRFG